MDRRTQEQLNTTLRRLLPLHNSRIAESLTNLATSLLLQSRARVPSLKSEEEPARCHAVCEIACQRLKTRLNLPKIESGPPIQPRTYKKLYQYLDRTLEVTDEAGSEVGTARVHIGRVVTPAKTGGHSAAGTPASRKRQGNVLSPSTSVLEELVGPEPATTGTRKRKTAELDPEVQELLAAQQGTPSKSSKRIATRERSPRPHSIGQTLEDEMLEVDFDDLDDHVEIKGQDLDADVTRHAGLGSLMETRFDWLSDKRKNAYAQWEAKMFRRIELIERRQTAARLAS